MSEREDLPSAAQILLVEYHGNWLPASQVLPAGSDAANAGIRGFIHFPDPPLSPQQEADFRARWRAIWTAAEEAKVAAPVAPPGDAAPATVRLVEKWALIGAAADPRPDKSDWIRIWALARTQVGQPSDVQEWENALLAAENAPVPAPEPVAPPAPANPYPLRSGKERDDVREHLPSALVAVDRLEQQVARLDNPLLLGYADVAFRALEHLAKTLEQSPNPYPLDDGIIAKGEQP